MNREDSEIKPIKNCPKCGGPVMMDILYHGPGADGFEERCTNCTWVREIHFTQEGGTTKEKW